MTPTRIAGHMNAPSKEEPLWTMLRRLRRTFGRYVAKKDCDRLSILAITLERQDKKDRGLGGCGACGKWVDADTLRPIDDDCDLCPKCYTETPTVEPSNG